ncbi:rubrerythrin family protein [Halomarina oriensis]|uniref:Rubrerythrin family protein n=1 Tax=Halomarina oriensis TaxID=671145 RepID=A0A6B0GIZ5_9EURY|nr:rubrerythrin family protein [Halomarina oriensis]MWG34856.1 rubrerythrin family protein [Halomarina oriensis]
MTTEEFADRIREDNRTALSRLGSSKALYADTGGDIERDTVLRATAEAERAAWETYEGWGEDEDGDAGETFAAVAEEEQEHYELVSELLGEDVTVSEVPAIQQFLREQESTVERAGGFLGRTLAAERSKDQLVGFFVGQADPTTTGKIREMNSDLEGQLDRALSLLDSCCERDEDWDRAADAASGAIQAAYEEYTDRLEGMGVNPKPVC